MRGLADPDSKIFSLLNKLGLLIELNLLVVLCCLPVVTAGAALCSMHAVLLKIYRNEDRQIVSDFFRAMKSNLKNGTVLLLVYVLFLLFLAGLWGILSRWVYDAAVYVLFALLLAAALGLILLDWAMILQSRYVYTAGQCLKYAVMAWFKYPGSTFVYLVGFLIPVLLCCTLETLPLLLLGGITLPHLISATLYSRVFNEMEGTPDHIPEL